MERFGAPNKPAAPAEANANRERMIAELRRKIGQIEKLMNEKERHLLEAELRAAETGQPFDRTEELARQNQDSKKRVVKQLQNLRTTSDDSWVWDGRYIENDWKSYDTDFAKQLDQLGYKSMQQLVDKRAKALRRGMRALDLFGGAYFLSNLKNVSHMLGVRLSNKDDEYSDNPSRGGKHVEELMRSPKRSVLEGNLYRSPTWKKIEAYEQEKHVEGFDLIVCRPQGPFGYSTSRDLDSTLSIGREDSESTGAVLRTLLERTLSLMSQDGGLFFLQIPHTDIHFASVRDFWKEYIPQKEKEGYTFHFNGTKPEVSSQLLVERKRLS